LCISHGNANAGSFDDIEIIFAVTYRHGIFHGNVEVITEKFKTLGFGNAASGNF